MTSVKYDPNMQNNRIVYKPGEKPDYDKVLRDKISGASRVEEINYVAYDLPNLNSTKKIYYDKNGEVLAREYISGNERNPLKMIETPEANYYDFDRDGKIDEKVTDIIIYEKENINWDA